jgi:serine/threonine protein kinase
VKKPIPFGKYLLLERVNVGGMAEVFKAKAFGVEGFERLVAVKRILPSIAEDVEFITMFIDEAKIAVQLTHANIAQIFDLGRVSDSYFIAMEFVHGKDLRAIFDRARKRGEPLPVPMACYVIMKVCEGLDYAHNKKDSAGRDLHLVHRDVSPQNILISYDGEVKIIDFGIAKAAGKAGKTQAGILKGKFGYMSPEQVRGLPLDRRSDVFAVGICLYELLTGERLFVGESDFSTLEKVRNVEIMPPSTYNRRIPEELEQIVLKALARDVDDRYQTAMDLHDDLQSFMYTSGNFFARKDLSAFMRKGFSDEIAKETARDEQYRAMEMPQGSGLDAFDDLAPAAQPRAAANVSSAQNRAGGPKRTMLGMGATPPPPPGRVSNPGPPPPPPPRTSRPNPPPPVPSKQPPQPPPPQAMGASLDMDWDDEELSTQIYDKPEGGATIPDPPRPAPAAAPAPLPPTMASPVLPRPPISTPPSAGPPAPAPKPAFTPPAPLPGPRVSGAPSPFEGAPARQTATAVTREKKSGGMGLVLGLLAFVLIAGAGVGAWFFLFNKDPGTIQLTTTPADPVVLFDEQPVPATSSPFVIPNVEPNTVHLLEVRKAGFRTWSMQVQVQPGQLLPLPAVTLEPEAGAATSETAVATAAGSGTTTPVTGTGFTLDSEPSGAKVFVDDRELPQRTPVQMTDLAPGSHTIKLENGARYATWQTQIEVAANQVLSLPRATLELARVTVRFASVPEGATVTIVRGRERRNVGATPTSADVDLTGEGRWTIEMALAGHEPWSQELATSGEEEVEVRAELTRRQIAVRGGGTRVRGGGMQTGGGTTDTGTGGGTTVAPTGGSGTLSVQTVPWTQVYVDGRLLGNTPQINVSLPSGSHRVTLVNEEFNIRENVNVIIRAGQAERLTRRLTPG